jgi:hypothetical protein
MEKSCGAYQEPGICLIGLTTNHNKGIFVMTCMTVRQMLGVFPWLKWLVLENNEWGEIMYALFDH